MYKRVCEFVKENSLILDGDSIIVGVSGGADSVCLLKLLCALKEEKDINIYAVHVNHGIRGEAANEDEAFVTALCNEYKVPLSVYSYKVREMAKEHKCSEEEMGRMVRYESFAKEMEKNNANKIAVAHHKDDNVETVLLNLFRGSGLNGLSGMPLSDNNIIRPLLCVSRSEIEEFLNEENVNYRTDATNFEIDYTRNKIRLELLPYAKENINEKVSDNIAFAASTIAMARDFIDKQGMKAFEECATIKDDSVYIECDKYCEYDDIIRLYVIKKALYTVAGTKKDISRSHILAADALKDKQSGKQIDIINELAVRREYERMVVFRRNQYITKSLPKFETFIYDWDSTKNIKKFDYTKQFDYDKIVNSLKMRTREDGDYLVVDAKGGKKKLKDYFIDIKMPREERGNVPLLVDGNHVVWVVGHRISEAYKITDTTKRVIEITIKF